MKKQYSAKIGTPDEFKSVETEGPRDILVEARDVYEAHKIALTKTKGVEEVLTITYTDHANGTGYTVYDIVRGFA